MTAINEIRQVAPGLEPLLFDPGFGVVNDDGHSETITVLVDPATLTEEARRIWLRAGNGKYQEFRALGYTRTYDLACSYCGWGSVDFVIDSFDPTPTEISAVMTAALAEVHVKRAEEEQQKAEREQSRLEAERKKAADEAARKAARELLADEFAAFAAERERLETKVAELQDELNDLNDDE